MKIYNSLKNIMIIIIIVVIFLILPHEVTCEEIFSYPPEILKAVKEGIINSLYALANNKEFIDKYGVDARFNSTFFSKAYIKDFVERLSLDNISHYQNYNVMQLKEHISNLFLEDIAERANVYKYPRYKRDINDVIIVKNIILTIRDYLNAKVEINGHYIPADIVNTVEIWNIIMRDPIAEANYQALEIFGIESYIETPNQINFLRERDAFIWKEKLHATHIQSLCYLHFTFEEGSLKINFTSFFSITIKLF